MKVGFTGTQRGMTDDQKLAFAKLLLSLDEKFGVEEFHHGDCIGADAEAHGMAKLEALYVAVHPPTDASKRAFCEGDFEYWPYPYLVRNHHIVDMCDVLIACPGEYEEKLRSGTWATVRYSRKTETPRFIVYPDGTIKDH